MLKYFLREIFQKQNQSRNMQKENKGKWLEKKMLY